MKRRKRTRKARSEDKGVDNSRGKGNAARELALPAGDGCCGPLTAALTVFIILGRAAAYCVVR
jgi:hypothetical protein